jgi:hypothetical protein
MDFRGRHPLSPETREWLEKMPSGRTRLLTTAAYAAGLLLLALLLDRLGWIG